MESKQTVTSEEWYGLMERLTDDGHDRDTAEEILNAMGFHNPAPVTMVDVMLDIQSRFLKEVN